MDPLISVENRINELECKLGYSTEFTFTKTAMELFEEVETSLNTTTSARESVLSLNKRLGELNTYLDPQYVNQINDAKLKIHYLLSNESALRHYCDSMQQCQEKCKVLDSKDIANIPSLMKDLERIKEAFIDIKYQCDQVDQCVMQAMETYNNVFLGVMEQLTEINKKIDAVEKMEGKK